MILKYQNFSKSIITDFKKKEKSATTKAAQHVKKKMKEKVSNSGLSQPGQPPGKDTGDLQKGIDYQPISHAVLVGVGPPAYHAHLLEFGTQMRTVKNYHGKDGVQVSSGRVEPRPFVFPTFEEETPEVERILSEKWT